MATLMKGVRLISELCGKILQFSMSQSCLDNADLPCNAHLVVFSPCCWPPSSSSTYFFIYRFPFIFRSQAKYTCRVKLYRTVASPDENPGEMCWKLLSFCLRRGPFISFCVQCSQAQLFAQFNTNCLTNILSCSVLFFQPVAAWS